MSDDSVWRPEYAEEDPGEPRHLALDDDAPTEDHLELLEDPFADDLDQRLRKAAPLKLANRATYILVALVIGVAGFVAGAQVQKSYGTASAGATPRTNLPTALPSGFTGFGNRGGNAGNGATGGRGITGTVKLVDGTTVYVVEADGTVVTVKTSGSTTVSVPGALGDLKPGQTVSVQGENSDNTITATSVTRTK
jgi:hypothetical protein